MKTLSLALVLSLVFNPFYAPHAFAKKDDEYNKVCGPITSATPSATTSGSAGGDQAKAECAKAKMSMKASKIETTKLIIFGSAAAICTVNAVLENLPWSAAAAKAICTYLSLGVSASTMFMDSEGVSKNKDIVGGFAASASQVVSAAGAIVSMGGLFGGSGGLAGMFGGGKAAASTATTAATEATEKAAEESAKKTACITSAITLGVQAAISGVATAGAGKTFNTSLRNARNISEPAATSNTQLNLAGGGNPNGVKTNAKPGSGGDAVSSDSCDSKSGTSYLSCLGTMDPDLAAISNNPEFLGTMEKALGGKSLGDFAKNYKGESQQDAANYIGAGLGLNGGAVAKLMDNQEKMARSTGAMDKYEAMKYARAGGSSSAHGGDVPDFGKMMEGMLKQLNPGADGKKENAAELVFRQLDLLPPEKIEQNKEISLFARIGYRYRKNASNVEQLNWSKEENQESSRK